MQAPTQRQLPAIGSIFPSVAAFKLACHHAALAGGFEITTTSSNTQFATMNCRLSLSSTASTLGRTSGDACSLFLHAKKTSDGIKVTKACYRHSCSAKSGPVAFPSSTESFASARDVLIRFHAYSQQRKFTLHRRNRARTLTRILLRCFRHHTRFRNDKNGCCKYSITVEKKDAQWRITDTNLEHNHSLDDERGVEAVKRAQGSAKRRKAARLPANSSDAGDSSSDEFSPSPPLERKAARPSASRPIARQSFTSAPSAPASQLLSLLCALLPDTLTADLDYAAILLLSLGVDSVTSLAELVLVADETLLRWMDHLGSGGAHEDGASAQQVRRFAPAPKETCMGLLSAFEAMRAAFEEEK
ncbi:hypothetical protein JCM10207_003397 [Rhodosporidiobolus poonsookiae]